MIGWQAAFLAAKKLEQKKQWHRAEAIYSKASDFSHQKNAKLLFHLGHSQFMQGKDQDAIQNISKAVILSPDSSTWHYRLGFILERQKLWDQALVSYEQAILLDSTKDQWYYRRGLVQNYLGLHEAALASFQIALQNNPENPRYSELTSKVARQHGRRWQELNTLRENLGANKTNIQWLDRLGESSMLMNDFSGAAEAFAQANKVKANRPMSHYDEGLAYERAGNSKKSVEAYNQAILLDRELNSNIVGIGAFHQKRANWPEAVSAYKEATQNNPHNSDLHYRLGLSYEKIMKWDEAATSYQLSASLSENTPRIHYKYATMLERQKKWSDAADAYQYAITLDGSNRKDWRTRLAYVSFCGGNYEYSSRLFLNRESEVKLDYSEITDITHDENATDTTSTLDLHTYQQKQIDALAELSRRSNSREIYARLGDLQSEAQQLDKAKVSYGKSIDRQSKVSFSAVQKLANILYDEHKFEEASFISYESKLLDIELAQQVGKKNGLTSPQENRLSYLQFYKNLSIKYKHVFFESNHGASLTCSPLSILESLLNDDNYIDYTFVCVVNDRHKTPQNIFQDSRVIIVQKDSESYLRYLATCKYLVNNSTFPPYFIRKDGQRYLNTWHGTPLKAMGKYVKSGAFEHKNVARNFLHTTHLIVPNDHTAEVLIEAHDVKGHFKGKIGLTGYPRIDKTMDTSHEKRIRMLQSLGISPDTDKPVVFYAPTWRGGLAVKDREFDDGQLLQDIQGLVSDRYHLVFRAHHFAEEFISSSNIDAIIPSGEIDTNDILSLVDVLITDYSSVFFDYMATGKKMIFYAYDLDEYRDSRGFCLDIEDMPGPICKSLSDVCLAIDSALAKSVPSENYRHCQSIYTPMEDGNATERAIAFFFEDDDTHRIPPRVDNRKKLLFYQGSFMPNGITTAFGNLIASLDPDKYNVTIVIEPNTVYGDPERLNKFLQLPENVQVLGRVGVQLLSSEENWGLGKFNSRMKFDSPALADLHQEIFDREFLRLFGDAEFDAIIDFEGYSRFWAGIFSTQSTRVKKRLIYLHNDMRAEWLTRFPDLECVFSLYSRYDEFISVTKSVMEENSLNLSEICSMDENVFSYANNPIEIERVPYLSSLPADSSCTALVDHDGITFITMGRLSPEKDHQKLIDAFSVINQKVPNTRLLILGEGPLRGDLEHQIKTLDLEGQVTLVGLVDNPFPLLAVADCFVFSSNYEGQGLAVIEALQLRIPVVSTDVVGPRSVLEDGYGLLVDNSTDGLIQGMLEFISGNLDFKTFDPNVYQRNAVDSFETILNRDSLPHLTASIH
ncbi:CDP-glycerol glycerophosphotransferase family protein [Specibacter sp. NPDC078692]|uniref:CDP-glycerol glycerophosphotransferase family protein n=1 Tax=Specibacter sp. NPDC078692 TaxID=3155818 RepID=UPI0034336E74